MNKPILYVFNISHYCEKARWALDHFGIAHEVRHVMVGTHRRLAKKLGASSGSVPFLQTSHGMIAGSSAIVDWCEAQPQPDITSFPLSLAGTDPEQVRATEQRLDDVLGVHVRRFFYSDVLINAPELVRPLFSNGLPLWQRAAVTLAWSRIVLVMIKMMDLGARQGQESLAIVEQELASCDALLADGRPYLSGDRWTRADITAASLWAPVVAPKEHPIYATATYPAAVAAKMKEWADRPTMQFVRRAYATQR
jgi:glutathione S-transferase